MRWHQYKIENGIEQAVANNQILELLVRIDEHNNWCYFQLLDKIIECKNKCSLPVKTIKSYSNDNYIKNEWTKIKQL